MAVDKTSHKEPIMNKQNSMNEWKQIKDSGNDTGGVNIHFQVEIF